MNYEKAIAIVMQPTRWLIEVGQRELLSDNIRDLDLTQQQIDTLERHLLQAGMAVQAVFLSNIPSFLDVLSDLDIYTEHYSDVRAPTALKPRLSLGATWNPDGSVHINWMPHEEDFVGESRPIRDDYEEVNRIIELELDDRHLSFPTTLPPHAEQAYRRELNCAIVQGLGSLIRTAMAVAEVELENWLDFDPLTGAMCSTTPEMRVEVLASQGRDLCTRELADQRVELDRLLVQAGYTDLDSYRAAQRAAGPVRLAIASPSSNLDGQIHSVLRIERELQTFTQTLIDAEEAADD